MAKVLTYRRKFAVGAMSFVGLGMFALSAAVVPAFASKLDNRFNGSLSEWARTFTPSGVDAKLAKKFEKRAVNNNISRFPFTPDGLVSNRGQSMTVAARSGAPLTANAVSVRKLIDASELGVAKNTRLVPSDYRLVANRGLQQTFTLPSAIKLSPQVPLANIVGRSDFRLDDTVKRKPSRFNTNVTLDADRTAAPSPRGNTAAGEYRLNVGGSFSISRKVDVMAGVRYNSNRDRIAPIVDERTDNEAVYVGTKIRF